MRNVAGSAPTGEITPPQTCVDADGDSLSAADGAGGNCSAVVVVLSLSLPFQGLPFRGAEIRKTDWRSRLLKTRHPARCHYLGDTVSVTRSEAHRWVANLGGKT